MTPPSDPRDRFLRLIDLESSRVLLAPHITFVCGGPVDKDTKKNHSIRNMFMNLSAKMPSKSEGFTLAENFEDWKDGYSNLSDFENDIASISSLIVVILESPGSLAELGLFYANDKLRDKMIVVVHSTHHSAKSFIKLGLLSPLELNKEDSVLVYEIDSSDIDNVEEAEIEELIDEVWAISDKIHKSLLFDSANRGHRIFLVLQIIDLFVILTSGEIENYFFILGIEMTKSEIFSALYILRKFKLIYAEKRSSQIFYFSPPAISNRVELTIRPEMAATGAARRYDPRAIKIEVLDHYEKNQKTNHSFSRRLNLWKRRVVIAP
jgi:hypothetical protein